MTALAQLVRALEALIALRDQTLGRPALLRQLEASSRLLSLLILLNFRELCVTVWLSRFLEFLDFNSLTNFTKVQAMFSVSAGTNCSTS